MVRVGLAEVYRGKPPRGLDITPYRNAEQEARTEKRGMLILKDKYISPKEWRKLNKGK